jgi:hypothetical protein
LAKQAGVTPGIPEAAKLGFPCPSVLGGERLQAVEDFGVNCRGRHDQVSVSVFSRDIRLTLITLAIPITGIKRALEKFS